MTVNRKLAKEMKKERAEDRRYSTALMAVILTVILFLLLCIFLRITPFGDRSFLYEDMKQQYVDFFSYYYNVWHGRDSILHSVNCGLGSDMFGIWAYYLMSPFLLMFAIIPSAYYAPAVTFLIMIKLSAMAFCMSLMLSHVSKRYGLRREGGPGLSKEDEGVWSLPNREAILNIALSVAFAYCGWTVANMTNIMWLDAVILMPIVVIGFDKLMHRDEKGTLIYVLSVMAMIVVNYYIAAMVMMFLFMFAVLEVILVIAAPKEGAADNGFGSGVRIRDFFRYIGSTLLAVLLDIWFLVPVALSLAGSNKDHSGIMAQAFEKYLPTSEAVAKNLSPLGIIPKLFSMSYGASEIMEGLPNVYFGVVLIVPCILFFMNGRIRKRIRALFGAFLIVATAFFCVKPLNTLAHGGTEAYGYLYRYSFVFSFVCIIIVYLCITSAGGVGPRKVLVTEIITLAMFACVAVNRPVFFTTKTLFVNFLLIIASGVAYLSMFVSKERVKLYAMPLLGLILAADISLNFIFVYRNSALNAETASKYKVTTMVTETIVKNIREKDKADDYRIETLKPRTPNDSLHYGYRGTTSYNSLLKVENRLFMYRMGFNDNGLYTMYESGNTRCADALLGIKYLISADVVINEKALSADFITGETIPGLLQVIDSAKDPFEVQQILWEDFTDSSDEVFAKASVRFEGLSDNMYVDEYDGKMEAPEEFHDMYLYKVIPAEDGEVYFYMNRDHTLERSLEIWWDGELISGYGNASCQKVLDLGYHRAGEEIALEIIDADMAGSLPDEPIVVTERAEVLEKTLDTESTKF